MAKGASKESNTEHISAKPPRIVSHLQSCCVNDGQPVSLRCSIKGESLESATAPLTTPAGDSPFDVIWLHNGKEIKKSNDFNYRSEGDDYVLDVAEVFPEDAGTYTCEAFNDSGESFSTCSVLVKGSHLPGGSVPLTQCLVVPNADPKGPSIGLFPRSLTSSVGAKASFTVESEVDVDKGKCRVSPPRPD